MSVSSWFLQSQVTSGHDRDSPAHKQAEQQASNDPTISTCRPMSYQEEGAKVCGCAGDGGVGVYVGVWVGVGMEVGVYVGVWCVWMYGGVGMEVWVWGAGVCRDGGVGSCVGVGCMYIRMYVRMWVHVCISGCFRMSYFNQSTTVYPEPGGLTQKLHFAESTEFYIFGHSCPLMKGTGYAFSQLIPHLVHTKH